VQIAYSEYSGYVRLADVAGKELQKRKLNYVGLAFINGILSNKMPS